MATKAIPHQKTIEDQVQIFIQNLKTSFHTYVTQPRKGRPLGADVTFENVISRATLIAPHARLMEANPIIGYIALARLMPELSEEIQKAVFASDEASHQGLLPCDEPAQGELFIQTHIRVTEDDEDGAQFKAEVRRAIQMAKAVSQKENATLYVRYMRNAVERGERNKGRHARSARYGGRLYISDSASHSGLLLAIVTPNQGKRTTLGKVEFTVPGFGPPSPSSSNVMVTA